jgi:imidazole glycerol-phosphate synthase subunit HisH
VLPGVGSFPRAMENLRELGLDELLRERLAAGVPVLGICLGMQLAFDSSVERGGAAGLGIVPGEVHALQTGALQTGALQAGALKLPHIGWNEVRLTRPDSPLLASLPDRCAFYHVHSFAPVPSEERDIVATAEYGQQFVTAVQRGSFYGVQFHPEKSSAAGLRLLANFAHLCLAAAPVPG